MLFGFVRPGARARRLRIVCAVRGDEPGKKQDEG